MRQQVKRKRNSEEAHCLLANIFMCFYFPFVFKRTSISETDIYECHKGDKGRVTTEYGEKFWRKRYERYKSELEQHEQLKKDNPEAKLKAPSPPSFFQLLIIGIGSWKLIAAQIIYLFSDAFLVTQPLMMREVLRVVTLKISIPDVQFPYVHTIMLITFPYLMNLFDMWETRYMYHFGAQVRGGLSGMIFNKTMLLNINSNSNVDAGKMISLITTDLKNISDFMWVPMTFIQLPIIVLVPLGFVFADFGFSTFVTVGTILFILVIQLNITFNMGKCIQLYLKHHDDRNKVTNETLQAMRVVKYSGLESVFALKIYETRAPQENHDSFLFTLLMQTQGSFVQILPTLVTITTVACFCFTQNIAQNDFAQRVMPNVGFMVQMTRDCNALNQYMQHAIMIYASSQRIKAFLLLKEMKIEKRDQPINPVEIVNGQFRWGEEIVIPMRKSEQDQIERRRKKEMKMRQQKYAKEMEEKKQRKKKRKQRPTLQDISLTLPVGSLTMVIGGIGSGKTSIAASIIGDIERESGEVRIKGSIAYCPQTPWINNNTIRGNITFGSQFIEEKYLKIINVCCLEQDLITLAAGDQTAIGEKGVNLSGGQKARIQLARAVYSDRDIYILDDPLSAVDAHVGRFLFENCVCGELRSKTRLLMTNQLQYLDRADNVILLRSGKIVAQGTSEELREKGISFEKYIIRSKDKKAKEKEKNNKKSLNMKEKEQENKNSNNKGKRNLKDQEGNAIYNIIQNHPQQQQQYESDIRCDQKQIDLLNQLILEKRSLIHLHNNVTLLERDFRDVVVAQNVSRLANLVWRNRETAFGQQQTRGKDANDDNKDINDVIKSFGRDSQINSYTSYSRFSYKRCIEGTNYNKEMEPYSEWCQKQQQQSSYSGYGYKYDRIFDRVHQGGLKSVLLNENLNEINERSEYKYETKSETQFNQKSSSKDKKGKDSDKMNKSSNDSSSSSSFSTNKYTTNQGAILYDYNFNYNDFDFNENISFSERIRRIISSIQLYIHQYTSSSSSSSSSSYSSSRYRSSQSNICNKQKLNPPQPLQSNTFQLSSSSSIQTKTGYQQSSAFIQKRLDLINQFSTVLTSFLSNLEQPSELHKKAEETAEQFEFHNKKLYNVIKGDLERCIKDLNENVDETNRVKKELSEVQADLNRVILEEKPLREKDLLLKNERSELQRRLIEALKQSQLNNQTISTLIRQLREEYELKYRSEQNSYNQARKQTEIDRASIADAVRELVGGILLQGWDVADEIADVFTGVNFIERKKNEKQQKDDEVQALERIQNWIRQSRLDYQNIINENHQLVKHLEEKVNSLRRTYNEMSSWNDVLKQNEMIQKYQEDVKRSLSQATQAELQQIERTKKLTQWKEDRKKLEDHVDGERDQRRQEWIDQQLRRREIIEQEGMVMNDFSVNEFQDVQVQQQSKSEMNEKNKKQTQNKKNSKSSEFLAQQQQQSSQTTQSSKTTITKTTTQSIPKFQTTFVAHRPTRLIQKSKQSLGYDFDETDTDEELLRRESLEATKEMEKEFQEYKQITLRRITRLEKNLKIAQDEEELSENQLKSFNEDLKQYEDALESARRALSDSLKNVYSSEQIIKELSIKIQNTENEIQQLEKRQIAQNEDIDQLKRKLAEIEIEITEITKQLNLKIQERSALERREQQLKELLQQLRKQCTRITGSCSQLPQNIRNDIITALLSFIDEVAQQSSDIGECADDISAQVKIIELWREAVNFKTDG
ncbi:MAG: putative ABC transporter C family member 12, partial [Streblomastix strix]